MNKINKILAMLCAGIMVQAHSSVIIFAGGGMGFSWNKAIFKFKADKDAIKKTADDKIQRAYIKLNPMMPMPQVIADLQTFGCGSNVISGATDKISVEENYTNFSALVELGAMAFYPVSDSVEIGGLVSVGYDFGSFNNNDVAESKNKDKDSKNTNKEPEILKFSNGLFFKIGPAVKFGSFALAGGLRFANRKIVADLKKVTIEGEMKNPNIDLGFDSKLTFGDKEKEESKFVFGWFLDAMYLFDLSDQLKLFIKAGIGGDFDGAKITSDETTLSYYDRASKAELETTKLPLKLEAEYKKPVDVNLQIGLGWAI